MKTKKKYIPILLLFIFVIGVCYYFYTHENDTFTRSNLSYEEVVDKIDNPERGFYSTMYLGDNTAVTSSANLVHFRVNLGNFSMNYLKYKGRTPEDYVEGGFYPLSQDFLDALDESMDNVRQNGGSVILRFAYDGFDGYADVEPSMEGVLTHINQLQDFFEKNQDIIIAVESGFLGKYGEQHSSTQFFGSIDLAKSSMKQLVDALLEVVPEPITVSVRKPQFVAFAKGSSLEELTSSVLASDDKYYRVGIYNDGYLGSESDLGTFSNREEEVAWLSTQADHTMYGGEVAGNYSTNDIIYNSIDYISEEMFTTHTSYLNSQWTDTVIDEWKQDIYIGRDAIYKGQTAYTYIDNHLGYRLVLRDSQYCLTRKELLLKIKIENVGAGNILKEKETLLHLVDEGGNEVKVNVSMDVKNWKSRSITEEMLTISKKDLEDLVGDVKIYLEIKNSSGRMIQLANSNEYTEYGNLIAKITRES